MTPEGKDLCYYQNSICAQDKTVNEELNAA